MKIVSWNIGNFIWVKHLPGRDHYSFHKEDISDVAKLLKEEDADVIFLQEVLEGEDEHLIYSHFEEYPYRLSIRADDRLSVSLFISKLPIEEIHHTNSNDYVIGGITFFPIHLNAFSPEKRLTQTQSLLPDLPGKKGIIMGDTNFWIIYGTFLSRTDKKSYNLITQDHIDVLGKLGPTCRIFLSLDKLFTTKDLVASKAKIVRHRIGHIDHYLISATIETKNTP